jgi:hypothetical protein
VRVLRVWFEAIDAAGDRYRDQGRAELVPGSADEFRFHERGGFWNDTSGRAVVGITKADVLGCRRDLRAYACVRLSFVDVDAILTEAVMTRGLSLDALERVARHPTWNKVKSRNRKQARAAGKCGMCTVRPAAPKKNGKPGSTCVKCRASAADRKVRQAMRDELRDLRPLEEYA